MADAWIAIGRVRSVNPRAREVRVEVLGGHGQAFDGMEWIRFARGADELMRCKVAAVRGDGNVAVVALSAGLPRDVVGQLRGARVIVTAAELPSRTDGAWRLEELVGMTVMAEGGHFGTVCEVFEGPANDAFAVERANGSRCVLPAIPELMVAVDLDGKTIEIGDVGPFIVEE